MTDTPNLALPCIEGSQAQKHVTHNEALRVLDTLVQLAVLDRDLTAPPGAPTEGQRWIVKTGATGAWASRVNAIAAWQDGAWQFSTPRIGWLAYVVDESALLVWNGSAWVTAIGALAAGRELLTANRTYYVRTDGSNSNNGLTNAAGGAFLTIQKAIDMVAALDISIYAVTIQIGNGTYTGANSLKAPVGSGEVVIVGDETTPANVLISTTSANCFSGTFRGIFRLRGMKMTAATTGALISVSGAGAVVYHRNNDYAAAANYHLIAINGANILAEGNYFISGNAYSHLTANGPGAYINIGGSTVTLSGTPAFTLFASSLLAGVINAPTNVTFSGSATGARYSVTENGVIRTNGGGASWLPGNSAGSTATGGQYT